MQGGTVVANAQTAEDGSFAVMELRPGEYSLARGSAGGHALCGEYFA